MSESDESGLLHEKFSRFALNSDDLIVPNDAGYGRILPKDGQRHSLSSHSVVLSNYSQYEDTDKSITRSLPGSNLSSPGRGSFGKPYRPVGAIESFLVEPSHQSLPVKNVPPDYKIYERGHIIAANRYAAPRPVEQIICNSNENDIHKLNGEKYYSQVSYATNSPKHESDLKRQSSSDKYSSSSYIKQSPTHSSSGKVSQFLFFVFVL